MTSGLVAVLLWVGVTVVLTCCLGVWLVPAAADRLHYLSPASTLGAALLAAAVLVQEGFSRSGVRATLIAAVLIATAPVLTHATGRCLAIRHRSGADRALVEEDR